MEKLIVSNFLNLKHIKLDLAKITIIIGSQAQGKSILAKLVFFFQDLISQYSTHHNTEDGLSVQEITEIAIDDFSEIFPYYTWKNQEFQMTYLLEKIQINLSYKNHKKPILTISDNFNLLQTEKSIKFPIFIPSNRAFFANFQENIFVFLSEKIEIDYFLKRFGVFYQRVKKLLTNLENIPPWDVLEELLPWNEGAWELNEEAEKFFNKILIGKYKYENGEDWIDLKDGQRINLRNASAGQQEALPLILILIYTGLQNCLFLLEEPEAHLFPASQKYMVDLISLCFNTSQKNKHFFITTHSPYILTAFNNLIQAGNSLKAVEQNENSESQRKKLFKVVPQNQILDLNDFGVYTLEEGQVKSIIDRENQLIDTNIIDEISNELSDTYYQLLELQFGN